MEIRSIQNLTSFKFIRGHLSRDARVKLHLVRSATLLGYAANEILPPSVKCMLNGSSASFIRPENGSGGGLIFAVNWQNILHCSFSHESYALCRDYIRGSAESG